MFLVISLILVYFIPTNHELLLFASIAFGATTCFFWVPVHTSFAYESKGRVMGKEAGIYVILQRAGSIIGPLLASVVILLIGFEFIYIAAIIFTLFAMVAVTNLKASFTIHKIDFGKAIKRFDKGVAVALEGDAINGRLLTFTLPLFMFIIIGSVAPVGWIISGAILLGFISITIVGYLSDYKKKFENRLFKIGISASSLSWIFRMFAFNFWSLLFLEYFDNMASSARTVPFVAYYYNKARNSHHVLEYTIIREIFIHSSIVISLIPITLSMMFLPIQYTFLFGVAAVWFEIFMIKKPQKLFFHRHMHPHK